MPEALEQNSDPKVSDPKISRRGSLKMTGLVLSALGMSALGINKYTEYVEAGEKKIHDQEIEKLKSLLYKEKFLPQYAQNEKNENLSETIADRASNLLVSLNKISNLKIDYLDLQNKEFVVVDPESDLPSWKRYEDPLLKRESKLGGVVVTSEILPEMKNFTGLSMTLSACSQEKSAKEDFDFYAENFMPYNDENPYYKGFSLILPETGKNGLTQDSLSRSVSDMISIWVGLGYKKDDLTQILNIESRQDIRFITKIIHDSGLNCGQVIRMYHNADIKGFIDKTVKDDFDDQLGKYPLWIMQFHWLCELSATGQIDFDEAVRQYESIKLPDRKDLNTDNQLQAFFYKPNGSLNTV